LRLGLKSTLALGTGLLIAVATPIVAAGSDQSDEAVAVGFVNDARARAGLAPVASDGALTAIARRHSEQMRDSATMYHNPSREAQVDAAGQQWVLLGENVGYGPSIKWLHDEFMASPSHREHILDAHYTRLGVGVARSPNGTIWITQLFAELDGNQPTSPTKAATVQAEDGTFVQQSYYCAQLVMAEDRTFVPRSYYGVC
jgi:uncharacterized protein YkwD